MKIRNRSFLYLAPFVAVMFSLLNLSSAHAQVNDTDTWDGGSGTWEADGTVPDWDGNNYWNNYSNAQFNNTPAGTISVSETGTPVVAGEIDFYNTAAGAGYTFEGGTLTSQDPPNSATLIYIDPSYQASNVTFTDQIQNFVNASNGNSYVVNDGAGTTLTFGAINLTGPSSNTYSTHAANGDTIIYGGAMTADPGLSFGFLFGDYNTNSTAVYEINGPVTDNQTSNSKFGDFASGNILLGTSTLGAGQICFVGNGNGDAGASVMAVLTDKAGLDITNRFYAQQQSNAEIGGNTAGATTYDGDIFAGQGGGRLDLNAASGGVVTFNGDIGGDDSYVKSSGPGTVILNRATGNDYTIYTTNAFEIGTGSTVQIMNTSNSAFGNGPGNGNTGPIQVLIDSKGTLSGVGISRQAVVAAASDSVVAPGTPTSIGQLNLPGGLSTTGTNGMTFDFKLNGNLGGAAPIAGQDNDLIVLGDLTLNGPITVNVTSLDGAVAVGTAYTFMEGPGAAWGGTDLSFNVNAPAGYKLDPSYGTGGYEFNVGLGDDGTGSKANTFSVEFELAPEPSTYALLGLGLLALFSICRWTHKATTHRFEDDQLADLK
jgi:hypothetical protein